MQAFLLAEKQNILNESYSLPGSTQAALLQGFPAPQLRGAPVSSPVSLPTELPGASHCRLASGKAAAAPDGEVGGAGMGRAQPPPP